MKNDAILNVIETSIKQNLKKEYILHHPECNDSQIEAFVLERYNLLLKYEGPGKMFKCKETFQGIDLKKQLASIRFANHEKALLIAVKDGTIIDQLLFSGKEKQIDLQDYISSGAFDFMKRWFQQKASVLNYHNHPDTYAARPSTKDILNISFNSPIESYLDNSSLQFELAQCDNSDLYSDYGLGNFYYSDWGVVTKIDFFSAIQKKEMLQSLVDENNQLHSEIRISID